MQPQIKIKSRKKQTKENLPITGETIFMNQLGRKGVILKKMM
jgi:hypothetical protein